MEPTKLESLLLKIHDVGAVKFGQYKLKTGLLSPIYIDIRSIVSFPDILDTLSSIMWEKIKADPSDLMKSTDFLAGVPYTALPIASVLAVKNEVPMLIVRKERKAYGTGREVEGVFRAGQTCLVIEDVVTSGASILETRGRIQNEGLIVNTAIVFIDRDQGGVEHLATQGVKLLKVTCMTELVNILHKFGRITAEVRQSVLDFVAENKQAPTYAGESAAAASAAASSQEDNISKYATLTFSARAGLAKSAFAQHMFKLMDSKKTNLCVAADVTTKKQLLELAEAIGPEICMLKTHIDILDDFDQDTSDQLTAIAQKHNFVLFEDRKFADIGNTVKQQYTGGVYKIVNWAHLTNTHLVSGASSVKTLSEAAQAFTAANASAGPRGILLLAQMSTTDTLLAGGPEALAACTKVALDNAISVSGFICQNRFSDESGFLYCTPGVHIAQDGDAHGQSYSTPEEVILTRRSDIIIVGRGIVQAVHPAEAAKLYRKRAWDAHIKKVSRDF